MATSISPKEKDHDFYLFFVCGKRKHFRNRRILEFYRETNDKVMNYIYLPIPEKPLQHLLDWFRIFPKLVRKCYKTIFKDFLLSLPTHNN